MHFLSIDRIAKFHIAAILNPKRIAVSPVHEPAKIIPLVHAAKFDPVTHTNRHTLCKIDIVRNQDRLAIAHIDYKSLVTRAIVIV